MSKRRNLGDKRGRERERTCVCERERVRERKEGTKGEVGSTKGN